MPERLQGRAVPLRARQQPLGPLGVDTVLDLGANIGASVRLWQETCPLGWIVAVEPDANNVENFFGEVLTTLGQRHRIGLMRGDSGFCIGTLFDVMEEKKIDYVVVARMLGTLKRQIAGLPNWVEVDSGVAVAECEYHAQGWSKPRRVVAVRYRLQDRPQGQLLLKVPGYSYAVYVTSLRLPGGKSRSGATTCLLMRARTPPWRCRENRLFAYR